MVSNTRSVYKRGQVEQAIARIHRIGWIESAELKALRSDVKRLLDLDRTPRASKLESKPERFAFFDGETGPGIGTEVGYRPYHAFALLLAYRMIEAGMTQSRAISFMREVRPQLEPRFEALAKVDPQTFQPKTTRDEIDRLVLAGDVVSRAEDMTFLIARVGTKPSVFLRHDPVYHDLVAGNVCTFDEMKDHLIRFDGLREAILVLGLTNAALQMAAVLPRTREISRGRPRSTIDEVSS